MSVTIDTCNEITNFNKYRWHLEWPRIWIIALGVILVSLCIYIAGMEVGHTVFDVYRSTAFAGFIIFIPLLVCAIFVLITACLPDLILLRIATPLCCLMIPLCLAIIAYDILVLIDPTRCFLLSCTHAEVIYDVNSTVTGWPLAIAWPESFRTSMIAKQLFQSIQLLCACLFIVFCSLYILTYIIYRNINLHRSTIYETPEMTAPLKYRFDLHPQYNRQYLAPTYNIIAHPSISPEDSYAVRPRQIERKTLVRPRTSSLNYYPICRRCMRQPRMISTANCNRQSLFSHVCSNCNYELLNYRPVPSTAYSVNDSMWTSWW